MPLITDPSISDVMITPLATDYCVVHPCLRALQANQPAAFYKTTLKQNQVHRPADTHQHRGEPPTYAPLPMGASKSHGPHNRGHMVITWPPTHMRGF